MDKDDVDQVHRNDFPRLSLFFLKFLAMRWYRPEPLSADPAWHVGAYADSLPQQRQRLTHLWLLLHSEGGPGVEVTVRWHRGIKLRLPLNDEIAQCVFVDGVFEPSQFVFLDDYLKPGMVFIDAGANNGLYALFAARKVGRRGRVLAFEPSQRELAKLRKNVRLNRFRNVQSFGIALGERRSTGTLHVAGLPYSGHNSLGPFGYESTPVDHEERVEIQALDDVAAVRKLERIDVMKLDVEGGELSLLQGSRQILERLRPQILIELSDRTLSKQGASVAETVELLTSSGYTLRRFGPEGRLLSFDETDDYDGENVLAVPDELLESAAGIEMGCR
jgi:FkbM family methyltransferase